MDILDRMPFKAQKAAFDKLLDKAEQNPLDPKERVQYESDLIAYRDWVNTLRFAVKKALAKGMELGREMARLEIKQKGIMEEICAIAIKMKKDKIDISTIMECTGLSAEEIEAL